MQSDNSASSSEQSQQSTSTHQSTRSAPQPTHAEKPDTLARTNSVKAVPSRPKAGDSSSVSGITGGQGVLRARRLVTDTSKGTAQNGHRAAEHISSISRPLVDPMVPEMQGLAAGTRLREGRYRLQSMVSSQQWGTGVVETLWRAQDIQRTQSLVSICALQLNECGLMELQGFLRRATIALTSVGRYPRVPTLWDVFSEQGQHFFVFELIEGETLAARLQLVGQPLVEDEVLEWGIQIVEILVFLAQQSSPLVHGRVRPEHIVTNRLGTTCYLTHFSPIIVGGGSQFLTGLSAPHLSPFAPPEFVQHPLDERGDLYALLASMYYLLTGHSPKRQNGVVVPARTLNPGISLECHAILEKGLHLLIERRYQHASTLLSDLRTLRSVHEGYFTQSGSLTSMQRMRQSGGLPTISRESSPTSGIWPTYPPAQAKEKASGSSNSSPHKAVAPSETQARSNKHKLPNAVSRKKRPVGAASEARRRTFPLLQESISPGLILLVGVGAVLLLLTITLYSVLAGQ